MPLAVDHVFVCCEAGAPEADALRRIGVVEGSSNVHPGQGTANRRFFFGNAFIELLWVADPDEVRSEPASRTRLWERWSGRRRGTSPFGIVLRPGDDADATAPFATWPYRPAYLPAGDVIEFAQDVPLDEPELAVLPWRRWNGPPPGEPVDHPAGLRDLIGVAVGLPSVANLSTASQSAGACCGIAYRCTDDHVLDLRFSGGREAVHDLRPTLPLILRRGAAPRTRNERLVP